MAEGRTLKGDPVRPFDGSNAGGLRAVASRLETPGGLVSFPPGTSQEQRIRELRERVNELGRMVAYLLRRVRVGDSFEDEAA